MEDEAKVNGAEAMDEPTANGVPGKDVGVEENDGAPNLKHKIEVLEEEKWEQSEKIKRMSLEIEGFKKNQSEMEERLEKMKKEVEQSDGDKRILESVAARAADLETEVARLQHDLVTSMSESHENAAELVELKSLCSGLTRSNQEKDSKIEDLEKTGAEMEIRIRTLEEKLSASDIQKRNIEEEATAKEEQIRYLTLKVDEMSIELKKSQKETTEIETKRCLLEEVVKAVRKDRVEEGQKVQQLLNDLKELKEENLKIEKQKAGFEKRAVGFEKEKLESEKRVWELESEMQKECTKFSWPTVAAASTGTVAAAAMLYLTYAKKR
ncbi:peroxisomal and mitochondrial division factor 1-like [Aristolochia californica]|uniref:peroxisomal and mitochondrial division factor 1-like n=1 Tax=Aristolochia californica TaxID=171875 RepID=UPI0035DC2F2F